MDAHLLFDRAAGDAVASADGAVPADQEFGDDKQRYSLDAGRRAFDAGQYEMDDVLREIMLAGGDENLRAGDPVAAVGLWHRAAAPQAEIGAALRLGEIHRAGPLAVDQFRQIGRLSARPSRGWRARRPPPASRLRIHGERHVGRAGELVDRLRQRGRQVLAAEFGWRRGSHPTGLVEPFVGVLESRRRGDTAVVATPAAFLVADAVERREYVLAEFCRLGEHRLDEIRRGVGKARQVVVAIDVKHVAQEEHHVVNGGPVGRHDVLLRAVSRLPVGRTGQRLSCNRSASMPREMARNAEAAVMRRAKAPVQSRPRFSDETLRSARK